MIYSKNNCCLYSVFYGESWGCSEIWEGFYLGLSTDVGSFFLGHLQWFSILPNGHQIDVISILPHPKTPSASSTTAQMIDCTICLFGFVRYGRSSYVYLTSSVTPLKFNIWQCARTQKLCYNVNKQITNFEKILNVICFLLENVIVIICDALYRYIMMRLLSLVEGLPFGYQNLYFWILRKLWETLFDCQWVLKSGEGGAKFYSLSLILDLTRFEK